LQLQNNYSIIAITTDGTLTTKQMAKILFYTKIFVSIYFFKTNILQEDCDWMTNNYWKKSLKDMVKHVVSRNK